MKNFSLEALFSESELSLENLPPSLCLTGEEKFLESEILNVFKNLGADICEKNIGKKDVAADLDELIGMGPSLFSPTLFILLRADSIAAWSKYNEWERLKETLAPGEKYLWVVSPKVKTTEASKLDFDAFAELVIPFSRRKNYLELYAKRKGQTLAPYALQFLSNLDVEFSELRNLSEQWFLGGDRWAEKQLGYTPGVKQNLELLGKEAAYEWVDAVLLSDKRKAQLCLKKLILDEEQEPLSLLALLSKSLKILWGLKNSWDLKGELPFLIDRLRRKRIQNLNELIQKCAATDIALKQSRTDAYAALSLL